MILPATDAGALALFATTFDPALFAGPGCHADAYRGVFGGGRHALFLADQDCLVASAHLANEGSIWPLAAPHSSNRQLVWFERAAVDEAIAPLSSWVR
jgi:hypothetical protein